MSMGDFFHKHKNHNCFKRMSGIVGYIYNYLK